MSCCMLAIDVKPIINFLYRWISATVLFLENAANLLLSVFFIRLFTLFLVVIVNIVGSCALWWTTHDLNILYLTLILRVWYKHVLKLL